jgi:hypothetical protein
LFRVATVKKMFRVAENERRKKTERKGEGICHRVEAHPGHGRPALDGRVHHDAAMAPAQVRQRRVGRVNVSPEVDIMQPGRLAGGWLVLVYSEEKYCWLICLREKYC